LPIIFVDRGTPLYARARCSGEKVLVSAFLRFVRFRCLLLEVKRSIADRLERTENFRESLSRPKARFPPNARWRCPSPVISPTGRRDHTVGPAQGSIRTDKNAAIMALVLLGSFVAEKRRFL
jgi:hypothetical protein